MINTFTQANEPTYEYPDLNGVINYLDINDPAPGVYLGVEHHVYLKTNAVSRSMIKDFMKGPEFVGAPSEEKPHLIFGNQYHAFILEEEVFHSSYTEFEGKRRYGAKYDQLVDLVGDPSLIYKTSDLEKMQGMKKALARYTKAQKILLRDNPREVMVVAIDPLSGLKLKIKIDIVLIDDIWIADLKTAASVHWDEFRWSIRKFGYDLQAGFYTYVCSLTPGLDHIQRFVIVAQSKKPEEGYMVRTYAIHQTDQEKGLITVYRELPRIAEWIEQGRPVPDEIIELDTYYSPYDQI